MFPSEISQNKICSFYLLLYKLMLLCEMELCFVIFHSTYKSYSISRLYRALQRFKIISYLGSTTTRPNHGWNEAFISFSQQLHMLSNDFTLFWPDENPLSTCCWNVPLLLKTELNKCPALLSWLFSVEAAFSEMTTTNLDESSVLHTSVATTYLSFTTCCLSLFWIGLLRP